MDGYLNPRNITDYFETGYSANGIWQLPIQFDEPEFQIPERPYGRNWYIPFK